MQRSRQARDRDPRAMDDLEIGWLTGIIEGEGCIASQGGTPSNKRVNIKVAMTDEDTIKRCREVSGEGRIVGPKVRPAPWKPVWIWTVSDAAGVARVLLAIYPLLGLRRQERIAELIDQVRSTRALEPCGTTGGYIRHRKKGEQACGPCLEANRRRSEGTNWRRNRRKNVGVGQGRLLG